LTVRPAEVTVRGQVEGVKHWSSAFVDHLRLIHFTLVAIAIGLLIIVCSSRPYDSVTALRDIEEIRQLQNEWSPKWVEIRGKPSDVRHWTEDPRLLDLELQPMPEFLCAIKMRGGNNIIIGHVTRAWRNYSDHPEVWSPGSFPRTASEFQKWWDLLEEPQESAFATVIAGGEGIFFTSVGDNFHFKASEMPVPIPQVRVVDFEMATSHDPAEYAKGEQALVSYDDSDGFQGAFNIPIARSTTTKVDQKMVISEFTNWHSGRFQDSFPDLYRATRGLEPLSLEETEAKLSEDASHSSDVFEVVGLKIPTEEVTTWGTILLLRVQLYLFLTLKELFSKLQPNDPGWETP
jgi:hypothetical protein